MTWLRPSAANSALWARLTRALRQATLRIAGARRASLPCGGLRRLLLHRRALLPAGLRRRRTLMLAARFLGVRLRVLGGRRSTVSAAGAWRRCGQTLRVAAWRGGLAAGRFAGGSGLRTRWRLRLASGRLRFRGGSRGGLRRRRRSALPASARAPSARPSAAIESLPVRGKLKSSSSSIEMSEIAVESIEPAAVAAVCGDLPRRRFRFAAEGLPARRTGLADAGVCSSCGFAVMSYSDMLSCVAKGAIRPIAGRGLVDPLLEHLELEHEAVFVRRPAGS